MNKLKEILVRILHMFLFLMILIFFGASYDKLEAHCKKNVTKAKK